MNTLIESVTTTKLPQAPVTPRIVDESDLLNIPETPERQETPATPAAPVADPNAPAPVADPNTPVADPNAPAPATDPNAPAPAPTADPNAPRGRGRPRGSRNKVAPSFEDVAAIATVDYKSMSEMCFDMTTGVLANGLGPEWNPKTPDERNNVCACLAAYLKSKQVQDIPPGLMLTIVVVAYSAPRLQAPSTQEKIKPAIAWGWAKFKGFFRRNKNVQLTILPPNKTTE